MEKKNTGLIVLVVILIILVLGLGGYIIYEKVLPNDNTESKENNINQEVDVDNETEVPVLSMDEVYNLVTKFTDLGSDFYSSYSLKHYFGDNTNGKKVNLNLENIKLIMAIKNTAGTKITNCATIANDDIVLDGEWYSLKNNYYVCFEDVSTIYNYQNINSNYKELFGSESNAPKQSIKMIKYYYYNDDQYITLFQHDDGLWPDGLISKITDFKQDGDKLDVVVSYLYDNQYDGQDVSENDVTDIIINNMFANRTDYSLQYKLEFEYEKDHYILKNIDKLI